MAVPAILAITPPDGFNQFPITGKVEILWDTEIDVYTAQRAISLFGPDFSVIVGPGMTSKPIDEHYNDFQYALRSPGFEGEAQVDIDVIRVDEEGVELEDQFLYDPSLIAYSKVIVTPRSILQEKTPYKLYIAGEVDAVADICISRRSVYDPEEAVGNTSTAIVYSAGVYKGSVEDAIIIEVQNGAGIDTSRFNYWLESNPVDVKTIDTYNGVMELFTNIYITLEGSGSSSFITGDQWSIALVPTEVMETTYKLEFITGSNKVISLPSSVSSSPIGLLDPTIDQLALPEWEVLSVAPENGASNLDLTTRRIVVKFSRDIDASVFNAEMIKLTRSDVEGFGSEIPVMFSYIIDGRYLYINIQEHNGQ